MHNREVPATAIIFVMRADRLIVYRDTLFLHNHRHHLLFPYFPSPRPERVGEVCFGKLSREPAPGKGAQRCFGPLQNRRLKPAKCDAVFKTLYARYQKGFCMIRDELKLNPEHRPHDGRKHFVTMAKKYGIDEYAIKYMVGHKISDITEKVYTQREFEWLKTEIEKIK